MGPWAVRGIFLAILVWALAVNFLFGGLIGGALTAGAFFAAHASGVPLRKGLPNFWRDGYGVVPAASVFLGLTVAMPVALLTDWPTWVKWSFAIASVLAAAAVVTLLVRKAEEPLPSEKRAAQEDERNPQGNPESDR